MAPPEHGLAAQTPTSAAQAPISRVSERVAYVLTERIHSRLYSTGEPLPTERVLAADLKVHRRSVRMAIDQLVREGLVSRRPNCRPTVEPSPSDTALGAGTQSGAKESARTSQISASNLIALIMWHGGGPLEHAGTSQQRIFWGMNQSLMKIGYHAVFLDLGGRIGTEEENAAREAVHLRYVRDQGFGGALFYPYAYRHNRALVQEVSRTVPLVLLDRKVLGVEDVDFVGINNYEAMRETTSQLIAQGHRRIVHLTRFEPIQSVQDRVQGYLDAMQSEDSPEITQIVLHVPAHQDDRRWTAVDAVFRLPKEQRPTAAVCVTDYVAVDTAERLERLGLSVPGDVALTGFDNIVPTLPNGMGLTTAAQPYEEIGTAAVELLLRRLEDRHAPPRSVELPVRLIARESSAS